MFSVSIRLTLPLLCLVAKTVNLTTIIRTHIIQRVLFSFYLNMIFGKLGKLCYPVLDLKYPYQPWIGALNSWPELLFFARGKSDK